MTIRSLTVSVSYTHLALGNGFSLDAAHMPGVPGEVVSRVFDLEDLGDPHEDAAAEVDVIKLRKPFGDLRIHSCLLYTTRCV